MAPKHPFPPPALDADERSARMTATVHRLRSGSFAEARDLVERWDAVADRSLEVYEEIGACRVAAVSAAADSRDAKEAAVRTEGHASRAEASATSAANESRAIREELRALKRGEGLSPLPPMRPQLPSWSGAEITQNGTVRLPQDEFAQIQKRVEDLDRARVAAETEQRLSDAKKRGADEALAALEAEADLRDKKAERWRKRILFIIAVGTPSVTALGWVLHSLLVH